MTRWARGQKSNKKKEHEASSWNDLKAKKIKAQEKQKEPDVKSAPQGFAFGQNSSKSKTAQKFRLQENTKLDCGDSEDDKGDVLIPYRPPADELPQPGLASVLESIKTRTVNVSSSGSQTSNKSSTKARKNDKFAASKNLLESSTTKDLLKFKSSKNIGEDEINEIDEAIKKDQRREQRRRKRMDQRETSKMCFHCRQTGHKLEECPEKKDSESGHGICYKCGSTEHSVQKCKAKLPPGQFPYAKCFICGQQGHLSKKCPDNPKGLYPNGGCCRECGSVEHYKKDCPELQKKQSGLSAEYVGAVFTGGSVDDDSFSLVPTDSRNLTVQPPPKKKQKVVTF